MKQNALEMLSKLPPASREKVTRLAAQKLALKLVRRRFPSPGKPPLK